MTALLPWMGLINVVLWSAVVIRFGVVVRRWPNLNARRQAWLSWAAYFSIALASTLYNPAVQNYLNRALGLWFNKTLYVGAMVVIIYVMWSDVCCDFAPHLRPRWNWPLYVGLLTIGVGGLLTWAVSSGKLTPVFVVPGSTPAGILFAAFLMVVVGRINIPALTSAYRHEAQRPMRLRFLVMSTVHAMVAIWVPVSIVEHLMVAVGRTPNLALIYALIMAVFTLTFVASYLMPAIYFVRLVQAYDYFRDLQTFVFIRRIELAAARWTGEDPVPIGIAEMMRSPAAAIYQSVIAIFDRHKPLKAQSASAPRWLGTRLDRIARPDLAYSEIIAYLRDMGRHHLKSPTESS
jgi:hypothetical protein